MEDSSENINYSDLMTCSLNKGAPMNSVEGNQNDCCYSDDALIEMINLRQKSIRPRKTVEGWQKNRNYLA